jgi:hypothetical protein
LNATSLKLQADEKASNWWITLVLSIFGSLAFVGILLISWHLFSRFYMRKISERKPSVNNDVVTK